MLMCAGAEALHAVASRPALKSSISRRTTPAMLDPSTLLANAGAAVPIDATLISQVGFAGLMIAGGFGLETFTEVEEEGIAQPEKAEGETDIYRDSLLRYCGYANEVGEAFRPLVPVEVVYFSYVIAITYILADSVDKGKKGSEFAGVVGGTLGAIDTFCWQMLASVLFPSFIINRAVLLLISLQAEGSLPPPFDVRIPRRAPPPAKPAPLPSIPHRLALSPV